MDLKPSEFDIPWDELDEHNPESTEPATPDLGLPPVRQSGHNLPAWWDKTGSSRRASSPDSCVSDATPFRGSTTAARPAANSCNVPGSSSQQFTAPTAPPPRRQDVRKPKQRSKATVGDKSSSRHAAAGASFMNESRQAFRGDTSVLGGKRRLLSKSAMTSVLDLTVSGDGGDPYRDNERAAIAQRQKLAAQLKRPANDYSAAGVSDPGFVRSKQSQWTTASQDDDGASMSAVGHGTVPSTHRALSPPVTHRAFSPPVALRAASPVADEADSDQDDMDVTRDSLGSVAIIKPTVPKFTKVSGSSWNIPTIPPSKSAPTTSGWDLPDKIASNGMPKAASNGRHKQSSRNASTTSGWDLPVKTASNGLPKAASNGRNTHPTRSASTKDSGECPHCGKIMKRLAGKHINSTCPKLPMSCPVCSKLVIRKYMTKHRQTHESESSLDCSFQSRGGRVLRMTPCRATRTDGVFRRPYSPVPMAASSRKADSRRKKAPPSAAGHIGLFTPATSISFSATGNSGSSTPATSIISNASVGGTPAQDPRVAQSGVDDMELTPVVEPSLSCPAVDRSGIYKRRCRQTPARTSAAVTPYAPAAVTSPAPAAVPLCVPAPLCVLEEQHHLHLITPPPESTDVVARNEVAAEAMSVVLPAAEPRQLVTTPPPVSALIAPLTFRPESQSFQRMGDGCSFLRPMMSAGESVDMSWMRVEPGGFSPPMHLMDSQLVCTVSSGRCDLYVDNVKTASGDTFMLLPPGRMYQMGNDATEAMVVMLVKQRIRSATPAFYLQPGVAVDRIGSCFCIGEPNQSQPLSDQ